MDELRRRGRPHDARTRAASPADTRVVPVPAGSLLTDAEIRTALENLSAAKAYGTSSPSSAKAASRRYSATKNRTGWVAM